MNKFKTLYLAALLPLGAQAQQDSIAVEGGSTLGESYTIALHDVQLAQHDSRVCLNVLRPYSSTSTYGTYIELTADSIVARNSRDTVVLAKYLDDGLATHHYTICKDMSLAIRVYRDNVLLGSIDEARSTGTACVAVLGSDALQAGYSATITPDSDVPPTEADIEDRIDGMLPATCTNLIDDPYFNHGFTLSGLNASTRQGMYMASASLSGWGPGAALDSDNAYSGKYCLRLSGRSVYPSQGASIDIYHSFTKGTPYLVRAMVKSDGYEGRIALNNMNGYIHITDTQGEWKQIEGMLTPTDNTGMLSINNADYDNDGTLWIDNLEVYEGMTASSAKRKTDIPYVMIDAGTNWATRYESKVYMLGLTDDGTQCATVDTTLVKAVGGMVLRKSFAGSQYYAMCFPGTLTGVSVTGWYDGFSHNDEQLIHGIDYALMRYEYPRFQYVSTQDELKAGSYLIQFVDNLDGLQMSLTFDGNRTQDTPTGTYRLEGNSHPVMHTPQGKYLKFDNETQRFLLTQDEAVNPLEAYITTDEPNPVGQIVPGTVTALRQARTAEGVRYSMRGGERCIVFVAEEECTVPLYSANGLLVRQVHLSRGENVVPVSRGIYLSRNSKVCVW